MPFETAAGRICHHDQPRRVCDQWRIDGTRGNSVYRRQRDGYLADADGGVDWMKGHGAEEGDGGYQAFYETVDTLDHGAASPTSR